MRRTLVPFAGLFLLTLAARAADPLDDPRPAAARPVASAQPEGSFRTGAFRTVMDTRAVNRS